MQAQEKGIRHPRKAHLPAAAAPVGSLLSVGGEFQRPHPNKRFLSDICSSPLRGARAAAKPRR